jgi:hypothetical protein
MSSTAADRTVADLAWESWTNRLESDPNELSFTALAPELEADQIDRFGHDGAKVYNA